MQNRPDENNNRNKKYNYQRKKRSMNLGKRMIRFFLLCIAPSIGFSLYQNVKGLKQTYKD